MNPAGEQAQPQDIAADLVAMIGAQDGTTDKAQGHATESDSELDQFNPQPTDAPDVAARIKKLQQTMTKRTTEIANERRKIQEERDAYQKAMRDAEAYRVLKESQDPASAAMAHFGKRDDANGGGAKVPASKIIEGLKDKFDPATFDAIMQLADAMWDVKAERYQLPHYQQAIHQLFGDRTTNAWGQIVAEYGDDAGRWKEEAIKLHHSTGLPLKQALMAVSDGQAAISKLRAAVLDKKKRETTASSVAEQSVAPDRIKLTKEQRNQRIMEIARAAGIEQYSRP